MIAMYWYAAVAALVFALSLDDIEPEAAVVSALVWPLWALFVVALALTASCAVAIDAIRRRWGRR